MKEKDSYFDLIEGYLEGSLNETELSEFHSLLTNNDEFKKEFHFRSTIMSKWAEANKYESVKKQIAQVLVRKKETTKQYWFYGAAAVLTLLILIPGIFILTKTQNNQVADSNNQEIKVNKPSNKASEFYFDETYIQIKPSTSKPISSSKFIQFEWSSNIEVNTAILIYDFANDSLIHRLPVNSSFKGYTMNIKINKGDYYWKLEGFEGRMRFKSD